MTWLDALAAIPWHQWVVMTFGTAGIVMTQIEATQRYACWPGALGQIGWAGGLDFVPAQIGMCVVSVICCAAWMWGLWRYWLSPWLNEPDETGLGLPAIAGRRSAITTKRRPRLQLVRPAQGVPPER